MITWSKELGWLSLTLTKKYRDMYTNPAVNYLCKSLLIVHIARCSQDVLRTLDSQVDEILTRTPSNYLFLVVLGCGDLSTVKE